MPRTVGPPGQTTSSLEVEACSSPPPSEETPVLEPGGSFEYTSYCPLTTAVGTMQGRYTMATPDGATFDAEIAPFTLATPNALN